MDSRQLYQLMSGVWLLLDVERGVGLGGRGLRSVGVALGRDLKARWGPKGTYREVENVA